MRKIIGILAGVAFLFLLASGIITKAAEFFAWLFMLDNYQPTISLGGEIAVRILTFVVTYELVGLIFNALGFFNSSLMKAVYAVVSAVLSFILAYVVWCIEQYILMILIVLTIIAFLSIVVIIVVVLINKAKEKRQVEN